MIREVPSSIASISDPEHSGIQNITPDIQTLGSVIPLQHILQLHIRHRPFWASLTLLLVRIVIIPPFAAVVLIRRLTRITEPTPPFLLRGFFVLSCRTCRNIAGVLVACFEGVLAVAKLRQISPSRLASSKLH
jgi:hypothetical protein